VHFDDEGQARLALQAALTENPENQRARGMLGMLGPDDGAHLDDAPALEAMAGSGPESGGGDSSGELTSAPAVEEIDRGSLLRWLDTEPAAGAIEALVEALDSGIRAASNNEDKTRYALVAGLASWKGLQDLKKAASAFKRVRLSDPSNLDALEFGVVHAENEKNLDALLLAYLDLARAQPDPQQEALVTGRAAAAAVDAGDELRGLDLWYRVLDVDPRSFQAWHQIDRLSESSGKWSRLTTVLKERLQQNELSQEERSALTRRLFAIYRDRVDQPVPADALAEEQWQSERWDEAGDWLIQRYTENSRWAELVVVCQDRAATLSQGSGAWVESMLSAADVLFEKVGKPDSAAEILRSVLASLPAGQPLPEGVLAALQKADQGGLLVTARRQQLASVAADKRLAFADETVDLARQEAPDLVAFAWFDRVCLDSTSDSHAVAAALVECRALPSEMLAAAMALGAERDDSVLANALLVALPIAVLELPQLTAVVDRFGALATGESMARLVVAQARLGRWADVEVSAEGLEVTEALQEDLEAAAIEDPAGWTTIARMLSASGDALAGAEAWQRAWASNPDDLSLLRHAAEAFEASESWPEAVGCWDMLVSESAADAADMARAAALKVERLDDIESAMPLVAMAIQAQPDAAIVESTFHTSRKAGRLDEWFAAWADAELALKSVVDLARTSGESEVWAEVALRARLAGDGELEAEATSRQLGMATSGSDRAISLARLAALEEQADRLDAAEGYAREALKEDASSTEAMDVLVRLAEVHGSETAAEFVEPALREQGRSLELLRLMDARATRAVPQLPDLWLEVVTLAEAVGDNDWALMALGRVMELGVPGPEIWERLGALASTSERAGRWFVAIEMHGIETLSWSIDPLAESLVNEARPDLLIELWDRVRRLPEMRPRALVALADLYLAETRIEDLERLCNEELTGVPADVRAQILCKAAGVLAGLPGRIDDATEFYKAALVAEPGNRDAFDGLYALYQSTGASLQAEMLIDRRLEVLTDDEADAEDRAKLYTLMARTLWDENGDLGRIVELLEDACEAGEPEVVRQLAQHVFDAVGGGDPESPAAGALIARSLERQPEKRADLIAHLEDWLVRAEEDDRGPIHLRLMNIALEDGDEDSAFAHARIGAPGLADPHEAESMLLEAASRTGRYADVLGLLEDVAARAEDHAIWLRLVDLYLEHMQSPGMAAEALVMALETGAAETDEATAHHDRLVELREQAGDATGTARALLRRAQAGSGSDEERASQSAVAGVQLLQSGLTDEAADAFLAALELDSENSAAIQHLPELLGAQERWPELADVLIARVVVSPSASLHRQLAVVLRDRLQDHDEAVLHFESAGELDPADGESWRAAAALHQDSGRDSMRINALRRLLGTNPKDAPHLRFVLAELLLANGSSGTEPLELIAAKVEHEDGQSDADLRVELLEKLALQPSVALESTRLLLVEFETRGEPGRAAQALMMRARLDLPAAERSALMTRAAALYENELAEPDSALHATLEAFTLAQGEEQLADIRRIAAQTGAFYSVSNAFEPLLRSGLPAPMLAAMHATLSELAVGVGDSDEATVHAEAAFRLNPQGAVGASALAKMLVEQESFPQLLELLDGFSEDQAAVNRILGSVPEDDLAALLGYLSDDEILTAHESSATAVLAAPRTGEHHPVMASGLARRLASAATDSARAEAHLELAASLAAQAGEHELALESLLDLVEREPVSVARLKPRLVEYARTAGSWERCLQVMEASAAPLADDDACELMLDVARIRLEFVGDEPGAIATLSRSLQTHPAHKAAHDLLLARLQRASNHPAAIAELERWSAAAPDTAARVEAMLRIASTHRDVLGDIESAIPWLHQAVATAPDHATASTHLLSAIERAGRWEELDELLTARPSRTVDDTLRLARVRLLRLGLTRDTRDLLAELIELNKETSSEAASAALNAFGRVVSDAVLRMRDDDAEKPGLASLAAELFEETGDSSRQIDALRVAVRLASDPVGRSALAMSLASLLVDVEPSQALDAASAALADDPQSEAAAALVVAIGGQLDRIADAVAALERAAESVEPSRAAELLNRAAELADSMLEDRSLAGRLLTRAALAAPDSEAGINLREQVSAEPSGQMARQLWAAAPTDERARQMLHSAIGDDGPPAERARLLTITMETVTVDADKAVLHRQLATLSDDADARIRHLADAVSLVPDDETALNSLAAQATDQSNAFRVVAGLEIAADQGVRLPATLVLADVLRGPASDPDGAIDLLLRAVEFHTGEPQVMERLTGLLAEAGRLPELAVVLRAHARDLSGAERDETLMRAAELLDESGDAAAALEVLQELERGPRRNEIFDRVADAGSEYLLWATELIERADGAPEDFAGDWLLKAAWAAEQIEHGRELSLRALRLAIKVPSVASDARTMLLQHCRAAELHEESFDLLGDMLTETNETDTRASLLRQRVLAAEEWGNAGALERATRELAEAMGPATPEADEYADLLRSTNNRDALMQWLRYCIAAEPPGGEVDGSSRIALAGLLIQDTGGLNDASTLVEPMLAAGQTLTDELAVLASTIAGL
jgi:tetratricopeptide (TPR) repeat protein